MKQLVNQYISKSFDTEGIRCHRVVIGWEINLIYRLVKRVDAESFLIRPFLPHSVLLFKSHLSYKVERYSELLTKLFLAVCPPGLPPKVKHGRNRTG